MREISCKDFEFARRILRKPNLKEEAFKKFRYKEPGPPEKVSEVEKQNKFLENVDTCPFEWKLTIAGLGGPDSGCRVICLSVATLRAGIFHAVTS